MSAEEPVANPVEAEDNASVSDSQDASPPAAATIFSVCKRHLDQRDFHYTEQHCSDRSYLKAGVAASNGSYDLLMDIKEERKLLVLYVRVSLRFPANRRRHVADYLTRCNYGLVLGNFEFDMGDGEVRYKCSVATTSDANGTTLAVDVVDRMLQAAISTMDRYFENMVKVGYSILDPHAAVEQVENGMESSSEQLPGLLSSATSFDSSEGAVPDSLLESLRRLVSATPGEEESHSSGVVGQ